MAASDLICDFVNTRELLEGTEALQTPAELASWLAANGLAPAGLPATAADLRRAKELREALRQALLAHNDAEVDEGVAYAVLDGAAREGRVRLRFVGRAGTLEPEAGGVKAALGRIAVAVQESMAEGSWPLLKACRASDCEWAFLDTAKNHSRAWCSMSSCGNREKARAFRERQRQSSSSSK
jgi:predicted RNA-binding Zn ribbon-like protein